MKLEATHKSGLNQYQRRAVHLDLSLAFHLNKCEKQLVKEQYLRPEICRWSRRWNVQTHELILVLRALPGVHETNMRKLKFTSLLWKHNFSLCKAAKSTKAPLIVTSKSFQEKILHSSACKMTGNGCALKQELTFGKQSRDSQPIWRQFDRPPGYRGSAMKERGEINQDMWTSCITGIATFVSDVSDKRQSLWGSVSITKAEKHLW